MAAVAPEDDNKHAQTTAITRKEPVETKAKEFADTTTLHGISHYYYADCRWKRSLWGIILFVTLIVIGLEVGLVINDYMTHPYTTSVSTSSVPKLELPDIVFCTKHRLTKSFQKKTNDQTGDKLTNEMIAYINSVFSERELFELIMDKAKIGDMNKNYAMLIEKLGLNSTEELIHRGTVKCEQIFKKCIFHGKDMDGGCCAHIDTIIMATGPCFVLNAVDLVDEAPGPAEQIHAGPGFGFSIFLDLVPDELIGTVYNTDLGYGLDIHIGDPHLGHSPLPFDNNKLTAPPGSDTHIQLTKTRTKLLQNCHSTDGPTLKYIDGYKAQACLYECMVNASLKFCKCAPLGHNISAHGVAVCEPAQAMSCYRPRMYETNNELATEQEVEETMSHIELCSLSCSIACDTTMYKGSVVYGSLPNPQASASLRNTPELAYLTEKDSLENRFVLATIYYPDISVELVEQVSTASINSMISNIGGQLGLFSGCSMITLIHVVLFWWCKAEDRIIHG